MIKKIVTLIIFITLSLFITIFTREQFPSIKIDSKVHTFELQNASGHMIGANFHPTESGRVELHYYCSENYNNSLISVGVYNLDESTVRKGDLLRISTQIKGENIRKNFEAFGGVRKDKLKKIRGLSEKLDLIYYQGGNITVFTLICFNEKELNEGKGGTMNFSTDIERPSFVDSRIGTAVVFLTAFIMTWNIWEIIKKIFN